MTSTTPQTSLPYAKSGMNQHGLTRTIPEGVRRSVRQRDGFGCVLCGSGIVDYEHVDPEFADAVMHSADGITLLCPGCHSKKTRGYYSSAKIIRAMQNPFCKRHGFSFGDFEGAQSYPVVFFAGERMEGCRIPIMVHNKPMIKIDLPYEAGEPYLISAAFFDQNGMPTVSIERNEWRALSSAWDVKASGARITVSSDLGVPNLILSFKPGHGVMIERIDMLFEGLRFVGNSSKLKVIYPGGGELRLGGNKMNGGGGGIGICL